MDNSLSKKIVYSACISIISHLILVILCPIESVMLALIIRLQSNNHIMPIRIVSIVLVFYH